MNAQERKLLAECAEATRTHIQVLRDQVNPELTDVVDGLEITATKLESLVAQKDEAPGWMAALHEEA